MSVDKKRKTFSNDGHSNTSEPVAKRTRSASKNANSLLNESGSNEVTILDVLNEDCWRVLLNYVSIRELVRSERVSQHWRSVVQRYLESVRLCLRSSSYDTLYLPVPEIKCRIISVRPRYYTGVVQKFGRAIMAADCLDAAGLRSLGKHCPDIEDLRIHHPQYHNLKNRAVQFNKLKRLSIQHVTRFNDPHITKMLGFTTLEELGIRGNDRMTGRCLNDLRTNLKTLKLGSCKSLSMSHLLSAADRLSDLTKLELNCNPVPILQNAYKLIERTPKLEYLGLEWYDVTVGVGGLVDAICRLKRLSHLSLCDNRSVTDEWLDAVGRSCTELRSVNIGGCEGVSAAGVLALCRGARASLTALNASNNDHLTDDDVVRCITLCPKLEILDVQYSGQLTRALPGLCARAEPRARPLRLQLTRKAYCGPDGLPGSIADDKQMDVSSADLILDYGYKVFNYQDY